MVTELFDLPAVIKEVAQITVRDGQVPVADETLQFGDARIGKGDAFLLGNDRSGSLPVAKTLTRIEGRDLLFESLDYISAKPYLDVLPPVAGLIKRPKDVVKNGRATPTRLQARIPTKKALRMAAAGLPQRAFAIDWEGTLSSGTNAYVFAPNHTTYISGQVTLAGSNYLMGGTVIKFAPTNNAELKITGWLVCQTGPYEMAVLTARDDHSVGSPVGSAALSGYYALNALNIDAGATDLSYVRIAHARTGVYYKWYTGSHYLQHSQLLNCGKGVEFGNSPPVLRNCLMYRVLTNFAGVTNASVDVRCEHLTINESARMNDVSQTTLTLTNSLLVNVTNNGAWFGSGTGNQAVSGAGIFTSVGAGAHYLPTLSPYRGVGTTNINAALAKVLDVSTVDPPIILTNRYTNAVVFAPHVQRGRAATESGYASGYWYPPIDFCISGVVVSNATALLTNGVVIATFGDVGMAAHDSAAIVSGGTPLKRNHICRYNTVQEQGTNWGGGSVTGFYGILPYEFGSAAPNAYFRFTDFEGLAAAGYHIYGEDSSYSFGRLTVKDCEFNAGRLELAGTEGRRIALTNNLLAGVESSLAYYPDIIAYNNLIYRGSVYLQRETSTNAWVLRDNVFDQTILSDASSATVTHDHNGYVGMSVYLMPTNATDVRLTNLTYQAGTLGRFYQPASNPFVNAGSRSGSSAGLYWYTCFTNNVQDTNTVDLGYHMTALNGSGQPIDTDDDGLGSWLEDADGDGSFDTGLEMNFNDSNTDDDGLNDYAEWIQGRNPLASDAVFDSGNLINLRIYTPLK